MFRWADLAELIVMMTFIFLSLLGLGWAVIRICQFLADGISIPM